MINARDLAGLRAGLGGVALLPGDPGFDAEVRGFNLAARQSPQLVVGAAGPADVAAAVRFGAHHDLPVAVQSTGHGAADAATGLLITTRRMRDLHIDPAARTARASAGVRWEQVIDEAVPHGLAPLNGSSVDVGVAGYLLGGGLSPMGRTFGFAADHVRSLDLVTADGTQLRVDAHSEPELFWALRGGKPSVGVVTAVEFDLMPVATVYGGAVYYAGDDAGDVLHAFRDWVRTLPDEANASVALLRLPDLPEVPEPLRGTLSVHLRYVYVGPVAYGAELLAPMRRAAPPLLDTVGEMPYAAIGSVHSDPREPMPVWDSGVLLDELPAQAVDTLLAVAGPRVDVPLIMVELRHLGGAVAREPLVPNAVGGRDAAFSLFVIGPMVPGLEDVVPMVGGGVLAALEPWSNGRCQINLPTRAPAGGLAVPAWGESTRARLRAVKRRYDAEDVFRFALDPEPLGEPVAG